MFKDAVTLVFWVFFVYDSVLIVLFLRFTFMSNSGYVHMSGDAHKCRCLQRPEIVVPHEPSWKPAKMDAETKLKSSLRALCTLNL